MSMLAIVLVSLLTCAAQLCQKQAAHLGWRQKFWPVLGWFGLSLLLLTSAMGLWLWVLQHVPVGLAYPMLSLNFVLVTLAARWLWGESISTRHWLGIGLIVAGVVLMGSQAI